MTEWNDDSIAHIAAPLRSLPRVRPEAVAGLLVAIAAERERERERARSGSSPRVRRWIISGGAAALAAGLAGVFLMRSKPPVVPSASSMPGGAASVAAVHLATRSGAADVASGSQEVELVLRAPSASRVHVAGDFNGWNQQEAAMRRDSTSGLWRIRLALRPGRHVYAFVVDDSLWVPDPRAAAATDADFGRPGSVLLVGRP